MRKVLIWRKSAYSEKWRIPHIRESLYRIDSSIRIELFVYNFRKQFSNFKNFSCISSGLFVSVRTLIPTTKGHILVLVKVPDIQ